jgi:hypothetical protein
MERAMNLTSHHLEFDKLADLAEGRMPDSERQQTLAHLARCPQCSEKLTHLERAIEMMRTDKMEDAPDYAFEGAKSMFRARAKPADSLLKQVLATLKFDSLREAPAFAVRSAASSERQLLFSAGENDLQLQIKQTGKRCAVSGQLLGPCAGGHVELRGMKITVKAALSDLCEFILDPVPEGTYLLILRLPDSELRIPDLNLGS